MSNTKKMGNGEEPENICIKGITFIDLGQPSGLLWANKNIGAEKETDAGNHYAWGEVETKDKYDWSTYKWGSGSEGEVTKYIPQRLAGWCNGFYDSKTTISNDDDVACVLLGKGCRIPRLKDFYELFEHTTCEPTTVNEENGVKFTSKINGEEIFLPVAGLSYKASNEKETLRYWTSSLHTVCPDEAIVLVSDGVLTFIGHEGRCCGLPVRPVMKKRARKIRAIQ